MKHKDMRERPPPAINLNGRWLAEYGFTIGATVIVKITDGCLVLIPDGPEETRLKALEQQLQAQRAELEQARQRIKATLA